MFKQQPISYIYSPNTNEFEPIFGTQTKPYIYNREIEFVILPWEKGCYIQATVINYESTLKKGNYKNNAFRKCIYDNTFTDINDIIILSAIYSGDVRGKHAEGVLYNLFIKYGMDIIKEYLPLLYNYLEKQKEK